MIPYNTNKTVHTYIYTYLFVIEYTNTNYRQPFSEPQANKNQTIAYNRSISDNNARVFACTTVSHCVRFLSKTPSDLNDIFRF